MKVKSCSAFQASLLAVAIFSTNQVLAEASEQVLEEVLVSAGFITNNGESALKSDVPLRDVPLTISGYGSEFMEAIETDNVSDLYNYMTGVQRSGNTAYDINIRGFATTASDRNGLMIDGLPGLAVRFGSPPTISAERVEVVKGPASILYGQVQPGGFINIITKKPQAERSTLIKLRGQSFYGGDVNTGDSMGGTLSFDTTGSLNTGDTVLYRVIGEYGDNPGWRDFGDKETKYIAPSLTVHFSEQTRVTGFIEYRNEEATFDDGLVAPNRDASMINPNYTTFYGEPGDRNIDKGLAVGLNFSHDFGSGLLWRVNIRGVDHEDERMSIQSRGFRDCDTDSVAGQLDSTDTCLRRRQRHQLNKRTYYFVDTNLTQNFEFGNTEHKILIGFNAGEETPDFKRIDFGSNNDTYDISIINPVYGQATPNAPTAGSWEETNYESAAVYLQDQISLGDHWKVLLGARYEEFDINLTSQFPVSDPNFSDPQITSGDNISPMVGVLYQPNEELSFYASYATSFNPPDPGRKDLNGNVFTDPETGKQFEIGLKANLLNDSMTLTMAIFQIEKQDSLQQTGISGIFIQTGVEESKGFEIEVDASITERWKLIAGYSFVDATIKDDVSTTKVGQTLRNTPENTASIWTQYDINSLFSVGLGVNYIDDRFGNTPDEDGDSDRLFLEDYMLVDAGIYYTDEEKGVKATLKLSNLLDEEYLESAFTERRVNAGAPANVVLSVSKSF